MIQKQIDSHITLNARHVCECADHRFCRHPSSNLPEISINEGFELSTTFIALVSRVFNTSNRSKYVCCYTKMDEEYNDDPYATKHEEHSGVKS